MIPARAFYDKVSASENFCSYPFSLTPFFEKIQAETQDNDELIQKIKSFLQEIKVDVESITKADYWEKHPEKVETLVHLIFPNLFLASKMGFLKAPFSESFLYSTPLFKAMLGSGDWEVEVPNSWKNTAQSTYIAHWIAHHFYGVSLQARADEILSFRNKKTGIQKFYRVEVVQDFIRAKPLKPLKKLSKRELFDLVENFDDSNLWENYFPSQDFDFEGFAVGHLIDVTQQVVLEKIKEKMFNGGYESDHYDHLNQIEKLTRSFLNMPNLRLGVLRTSWSLWQENTSWALLRKFEKEVMFPSFEDKKGSYGRLIKNQELVIIPDLTQQKHLCKIEEKLLEMGCKSLLLAPFFDRKNLTGIIEIASPTPFAFNRFTYSEALPLIKLLAQGTNKFLADLDMLERQTMQNEFTSIHPSVEWRFREVASKLFWEQTIERQNVTIDPIVFKELYPLYAQTDIVGSSTLRNQSIQADLQDNLTKALELMLFCRRKVNFHLLDVYISKTHKNLQSLQESHFTSSNETQLTEYITEELHPFFEELSIHFSSALQQKIKVYFKSIHPQLNIVYQHRKAYDESVAQLNQMVGECVDKGEEEMQNILPHYFEKFTTDGVEYNIYLGNSLLKNGGFSLFFLKTFRLWQLIQMCEITRLVAKNSPTLPVPLQTAQLIFVYNNTLSIRFKMEEKHFDVDGTYNVRYEILKKRVDKAVVKGTGERLTLAGKVSIVWLQEKDRQEYWEYLMHLAEEGYIEGEIETLELQTLQGAAGLRALRFEVKL